jgi:hypothetical protein
MALQSSGAISMSDIRSEIGTSGAISMSDLYRVNTSSEFPTEKEITNGISSVSYSGVSSATLGYSQRYMYGNLHTYSGGLGAGGTFAYGFMYNNLALSSVFNSININNGGITGSNYVSGGYANHILFHMGTSKSGQTLTETLTATMGRAGTYYVLGYSLNLGQLGIEVDTGSGFSTVYSLAQQSTTLTSRYTFNASVGHKIRFTLKGIGEEITRYYYLSTSSSAEDKTLTVNSGVPSSGTISFSDLYGAEG